MVLIFPVFLFVFMALVQWGLWFHAQSLATAAAQDGARAAQDVDGTPDDGRAVAADLLADATGSGLLEDVTIDVTEQAGIVRAEVRGQVRTLVPLPGMDMTVEGTAEGPAEQFTAETDR